MTHFTDILVVILIFGTIPAALVFPLVYGFTTRWWETLVGRALLVQSTSTLLLMSLALLIRGFDIPSAVGDLMRLTVMALIFLGVNLMCWALLREKWPLMRAWRRNYHHGRSDDIPAA